MNRLRFALALVALFSAMTAQPRWATAQDADPKPAEPAKDKALASPREQSIYIPYTKLREIFEKEGRGVFLPYEKFQELWNAAREKQPDPAAGRPPIDALITEVSSEATVGKEVMRVEAQVTIEVLAEGWVEVPLRLTDAAVLSATIGDQPARLTFAAADGYKVLLENKEKKSQTFSLKLEYAKAFEKSPGQNRVSFQSPAAPVNRWKIRIAEAGVKVNVHPMIAASEVPGDKKPDDKQPNDQKTDDKKPGDVKPQPAGETVVLAFVGAAPTVTIDWTPKAEGASGLAALATVDAQQEVAIEEGLVRTRTRLAYEISRAELTKLAVEVPADQKIVNVFDPNVRQWSVEKQDATQTINIELFEPARTTQIVSVELEKFSGEKTSETVAIPAVKALNVGRQQGVVVVRVAEGLRAEASDRSGLLQVDATELPLIGAGKWNFAYRYSALPFALSIQVEKVEPRIQVDQLVEAYLEPEKISLDLLAIYNIERAGVFELQLAIPPGYEVRSVVGRAAAGVEAAAVDSHHVDAEDKTSMTVNLSRKAFGRVGLLVQLDKRLTDPNLLTPTGKSSDVPLQLPRVATDSVERATGRLLLYAPESLRVNPMTLGDLRSISFAEALHGVESVRGDRFAALRPALAYAFTQDAVELTLSAERRKPYISVGQLLVVRVEAGVVKYEATFNYEIRYSGVKTLRIDIPSELAGEVRNNTSGIVEKVIDPPPADLAKGNVAWSLTGETELNGNVAVKLGWEKRLEKLEIGKGVPLTVPQLKPQNVDRAWGQIVLVKAESIDVLPKDDAKGLRPIDPQHDLMSGAQVADAARAFEFHDDWSLGILATRYELEDVKHTSVEKAVIRMVVTRSDRTSVQAEYRMRSARQRLAVRLPAEVEFDTQPLHINGRPATLERGDQGLVYVPLAGRNADEAFLLELRYTVPGGAANLAPPDFPDDPAVQKVYLCVYLPQEQALLGWRGPWTDELRWAWTSTLRKSPFATQSDDTLLSSLASGIDVAANAAQFQTDGKLYVFSTLRPEPGPAGTLSLVTLNRNGLSALVFIFIAVAGLALTSRPLGERLVAFGSLVVAIVLAGVFLPTFAQQVLDGVLILAMALVGLVWFLQWVATLPRRRPPLAVPPEPAVAAAATPEAPSEPQGGDTHA